MLLIEFELFRLLVRNRLLVVLLFLIGVKVSIQVLELSRVVDPLSQLSYEILLLLHEVVVGLGVETGSLFFDTDLVVREVAVELLF